jgi:hypothetical protein
LLRLCICTWLRNRGLSRGRYGGRCLGRRGRLLLCGWYRRLGRRSGGLLWRWGLSRRRGCLSSFGRRRRLFCGLLRLDYSLHGIAAFHAETGVGLVLETAL